MYKFLDFRQEEGGEGDGNSRKEQAGKHHFGFPPFPCSGFLHIEAV